MLDLRIVRRGEAVPFSALPRLLGREGASAAIGDTIEALIELLDAQAGDPDLEGDDPDLEDEGDGKDVSWPEGSGAGLALMRGGFMHDDAEAVGDEDDAAWTEWGPGLTGMRSHGPEDAEDNRDREQDNSDAEDTWPETGDGRQPDNVGGGLAYAGDDLERSPDPYGMRDRIRRDRCEATPAGLLPYRLKRSHVTFDGRHYF